MHGNKEYAYSPALLGHVVKSDSRRGRGSLLGPEAKNWTAIVFVTTRGPKTSKPPPTLNTNGILNLV